METVLGGLVKNSSLATFMVMRCPLRGTSVIISWRDFAIFWQRNWGILFSSVNSTNVAKISIPKNEKKTTLVAKDLINEPVRISLSLFVTLKSHRPAQQQLLQQSIWKSSGPPCVGLKNRDFRTRFPPHHVQYALLRSCSAWSWPLGFGSKRYIHIPQRVQLAGSLVAPFGSFLAASIHSCRYKCWFQLPRICRGCVDLEEDHNWSTEHAIKEEQHLTQFSSSLLCPRATSTYCASKRTLTSRLSVVVAH